MAKPTVLIVDDASTVRMLVSYALSDKGYQVLQAGDGKEGLALLERTPVDLIISDLNMPEMDGLEMVRQVRKLPQFRTTPIVLLTTESSQDRRNLGKEAGANAWMVKPFKPEQLVAVMQKLIPQAVAR